MSAEWSMLLSTCLGCGAPELTGEHSLSQGLPSTGGCSTWLLGFPLGGGGVGGWGDCWSLPCSHPHPSSGSQALRWLALAAAWSWHLTQEGRAAAAMVGEFLPLLDL